MTALPGKASIDTYNVIRYNCLWVNRTEGPGGQSVISFRDAATEAIYDGVFTKAARRKLPRDLCPIARRKLDALGAATRLQDLKSPGNQLEKLAGDRKGQYSIRINDKYRICFDWTGSGAESVEITNYH